MAKKDDIKAPAQAEAVTPVEGTEAAAVADTGAVAPAEEAAPAAPVEGAEAAPVEGAEAAPVEGTEAAPVEGEEGLDDPVLDGEELGAEVAAKADRIPAWDEVKDDLPDYVWLRARSRPLTHAFHPDVKFSPHETRKVVKAHIDNWLWSQIEAGVLFPQEP